MDRFTELTARRRLAEVVRWLCVLPAAVLGGIATRVIVSGLVQIAGFGGGSPGGGIASGLVTFLYHVPRASAFVIAGAKTAPRQQAASAIALAVLAILLSLTVHVVGQHFAGNRVGLANFTHFALESAGAIAGAAFIVWQAWRRDRPQS